MRKSQPGKYTMAGLEQFPQVGFKAMVRKPPIGKTLSRTSEGSQARARLKISQLQT